jgi:hypothetical protein
MADPTGFGRHDLRPPDDVANVPSVALSLLTLLFAAGPREASGLWSETQAIERIVAKAGGPPVWIERRAGDHRSFILIGDGHGRFQLDPPTEADLAGKPVHPLGELRPAPLLPYLADLLGRLPEESLMRQRSGKLIATLTGAAPGGLHAPIAAFQATYVAAASEGDGPAAAIAAYEATLATYANFGMIGPIASRLLVLCGLLAQVASTPAVLVEIVATEPAQTVLDRVVDALLRVPGGPEAALGVADAIAAFGAERVDRILGDDLGDDRFFPGLHLTAMVFMAAHILATAVFLSEAVDERTRAAAKRQRAAHDEQTVLSLNALRVAFANTLDSRHIAEHRERIARTRTERGEEAAELVWIDLAKRQRFYPAHCRGLLMGAAP